MQLFIRYWYTQSFQRFLEALEDVIRTLDNSLAVGDTARNIDKPLFQDYTYQGRIIGFFLRLARILIGLIIYTLTSLAYFFAYLLWLLFPFICLISLVGSILGTHP